MKKFYLLLITGLFTHVIYAQTCLPSGITFTNQADIDNFQANYPGCTQIMGSVTIGGSGSTITNLIGLNVLTSIAGDLKIGGNDLLTSLTGLNNLHVVGGSLMVGYSIWTFVYGNPLLTNLSGLNSLKTVTGNLTIQFNDALAHLTGLDSLTNVGGDVTIDYNNSLLNLNGLNALAHLTGSLFISSNDSLNSLTEISSLTAIGSGFTLVSNNHLPDLNGIQTLQVIAGDFRIGTSNPFGGWTGNASLSNLNGISSLTSIGGVLSIGGNNALLNLNALNSLHAIGGILVIEEDNSLVNLSGLDNIAHGSITGLYIDNNANLLDCAVQSVCDYLASPTGVITIHDNNNGCNTQQQVQTACVGLGIENNSYNDVIEIYPNPFSDWVSIRYFDNEGSESRLEVLNRLGQVVARENDFINGTGTHYFHLDTHNLSAGLYFYRIKSASATASGKMMLVR